LAESAWGVEKTPQRRKRLGTPQNPQRQVHALLGGFAPDTLIDNQNHNHKCLDRLDNQLTRLLHEIYSLARTKNYDLPKR